MKTLVVSIFITLLILPFEFLAALMLSAWLVLMFNLSGVAVLAAVGYWSLVWIVLGVLWVVSTGTTLAKVQTDLTVGLTAL